MGTNFPVEIHPLEPFLPSNAKVLFLGSFPPPQKRWSMHFYYPNFINDFWRITGLIFFGEKEYFIRGKAFDQDRVIAFCNKQGLAFYDTAESVVRLRENASDNFLQVVKPTDVAGLLLRMPECKTVVITGQKALDTLFSTIPEDRPVPIPAVGQSVPLMLGRQITLYRLPSTSRAYPKPLEEKADFYRKMYVENGFSV